MFHWNDSANFIQTDRGWSMVTSLKRIQKMVYRSIERHDQYMAVNWWLGDPLHEILIVCWLGIEGFKLWYKGHRSSSTFKPNVIPFGWNKFSRGNLWLWLTNFERNSTLNNCACFHEILKHQKDIICHSLSGNPLEHLNKRYNYHIDLSSQEPLWFLSTFVIVINLFE